MRTQKGVHSLRSTIVLRRTPYICSRCRRNASRYASTDVANYRIGKASVLQWPRFDAVEATGKAAVRWLSGSSRRPSGIDPVSGRVRGNGEGAALLYAGNSVKPQDGQIKADVPQKGDDGGYPSREGIRLRLRKWSEEQSHLADASGTSVPTIGVLGPNNSLDLEKADAYFEEFKEALDTNQDNLDEEDEVTFPHNLLGLEPGDVFLANL